MSAVTCASWKAGSRYTTQFLVPLSVAMDTGRLWGVVSRREAMWNAAQRRPLAHISGQDPSAL